MWRYNIPFAANGPLLDGVEIIVNMGKQAIGNSVKLNQIQPFFSRQIVQDILTG